MKFLIAMLSLLCCHQVFGNLTDQDKAVKAAYNPTPCETKYLNQNVDNVKRWATSTVSSQYFDLKVDSDTYTPGTPLKVTMNSLQVTNWEKLFVSASYHAGSWSGLAEKVVQSVDCSNTADAVSHKVDDRKTDGNKVEMTWTPDKDYGEVIFRATITQSAGSSHGLRLMQIQSAPITAKVGTSTKRKVGEDKESSSANPRCNNIVFMLTTLFTVFCCFK